MELISPETSKIKALIIDNRNKKHYWYSFTNENTKPESKIITNMLKRINRHFSKPKVIVFYNNKTRHELKKYVNQELTQN